jgi:hypothetical protein
MRISTGSWHYKIYKKIAAEHYLPPTRFKYVATVALSPLTFLGVGILYVFLYPIVALAVKLDLDKHRCGKRAQRVDFYDPSIGS